MEIELKKITDQEKQTNQESIRRRREKSVTDWFHLPIRLLASLPLLTTAARVEARSISVTRNEIELPHLPEAFEGTIVAFLTDFHCSALTPPDFLAKVIEETNRHKPDLILLGGDYISRGLDYLRPVTQVLRRLEAPLGIYGVLGNHDYWQDPAAIRAALRQSGIVDVTNAGRWVSRDGSRIRIAGVGDLWQDDQDLHTALAGVQDHDAVILLSHNPDYVMQLNDKRVGLVLSGHTHGGQIRLPRFGPVITNSKYGQRLASGLVSLDSCQLYTSRGIGTVVVPLRYQCPPEIALFTLRSKT